MQYLLMIYGDESGLADMPHDEVGTMMAGYEKFGNDARAAGVLVGGERLQPSVTATTVKVRDGERLLTDGPFAEAREQLGGYYLVDCPDLDAALSWAARIPGAIYGAIEVRPIWKMEASGEYAATGAAADGAAS